MQSTRLSADRSQRFPVARRGLLIAMFAGPAGLIGCRHQEELAPPPRPAVSVSVPIRREVTDYSEFTARVAAVESTEVRARVSGQIVAVPFEAGTVVRKNDVLVELDVRPFQAELDARIADEARAAAQATLAKIDYDRIDRLPADARSLTEFDNATARLDEARAGQAAAKAAVESARLNVEWCRVVAPISGRISYKHATTGNLVTGGTGSGTLLTTIVSVDPIYANFDVDERTVQRVKRMVREGKLESNEAAEIPVWLGLATESGFPHRGTINFVDNQVNPKTGTLRVRGVFPNADGALAPGYFARVRVPVSAPHEALLISERALGTDQGQKIVLVVGPDNKIALRPVQLGGLHDGLREIIQGLKSDDRVIVNGLLQVRPGMTVVPQVIEMPNPLGPTPLETSQPSRVASNPQDSNPKE